MASRIPTQQVAEKKVALNQGAEVPRNPFDVPVSPDVQSQSRRRVKSLSRSSSEESLADSLGFDNSEDYEEFTRHGSLSRFLPAAKKIADNMNLYMKYSGATQRIVYEDGVAVYNDTKAKVEPISKSEFCGPAENQQSCGQLFESCLAAPDHVSGEQAAAQCHAAIKRMGAGFWENARHDVEKMHPQQAVSFLHNLGFEGERRNNMVAFETTGSWRKRLHVMLQCTKESTNVCDILGNLKLMEYIELVWHHVHSNPQILNTRPFYGHHLEAKDGDCCGTKGFDIKVKNNVPGSVVALKRLMYQIKKQRNLKLAMLGIPQRVVAINLTGGGPETHILNNLKSFKFSSGADVVNEFLKLDLNSSSKLTKLLNMIVKEGDRVKGKDGSKFSNNEFVSVLRRGIQGLSEHERKLRRLVVAAAMLVDKISLNGPDIASDNVSLEELGRVYDTMQRYTIKLGRDVERISEEFDSDSDMGDDM